MTTPNIMTIDGYNAIVSYDPDIELFRGEFVGLNGGADFYADSVAKLREEGATSLRIFLQTCAEKGIEPQRAFSGKFNVRVSPSLHGRAVEVASAKGVSLNQLVADALSSYVSSP